jgi:hypothetical protein
MDPRAHENILEVFSDQTFVKDIVKGSWHLGSTMYHAWDSYHV